MFLLLMFILLPLLAVHLASLGEAREVSGAEGPRPSRQPVLRLHAVPTMRGIPFLPGHCLAFAGHSQQCGD